MSDEVDKIKVGIELDTSKLKKGIKDAETAVSGAVTELKELESTADTASESTEEFGESTEKAAQDVKELSQTAKGVGDSIKSVGESADVATDDINNFSESTSNAKDELEEFESVSSKLTGVLSVAGIVGALTAAAKFMYDLEEATIKTSREFEILYGNVKDAATALNQYNTAKMLLIGGTDEDKAAIAQAVNREYTNLDAEKRIGLQQELLNTQSVVGMSGSQMAYDLGEIASKWNVPQEETVKLLQTLVELSRTQQGDIAENFRENLQSLKDYDEMYQSMGWNLDKTLNYFNALDSAQNRESVSESSAMLYKEWTKQMSEGVTQFEQGLRENLPTSDEILSKLFSTDNLSIADFSSKGDLEKYVNIVNIGKTTDQYDFKRGTGEVYIPPETWGEIGYKMVESFKTGLGQVLFPTDSSQLMLEEYKSAQKEYSDSIMELFELKYGEFSLSNDEQLKEYELLAERSKAAQGSTELIQKYTEDIRDEIQAIKNLQSGNQKVEVELTIKSDNSYQVMSASAKAQNGNQASIAYH